MEFWNKLSEKSRATLGVILGMVFLFSGYWLYHRTNSKNPLIIPLPNPPTRVTIYITGMIKKPGVYTLAAESRVQDAIKAAGGPQKMWEPEHINLAKLLEDEDMIVVPKKERFSAPEGETVLRNIDKHVFPEAVSVNQASQAELESVPGIGPSMAQKIIAFRKYHGPFSSVQGMKKVPGLGGKKFEAIKPYLRL